MNTSVCPKICLAFTALVAMSAGAAEEPRTIWVASNGVDTSTCGSSGQPCRSISRGIAHAQDGDAVLVRPGRYGDLDGDFAYTSNGDETADLSFGSGCVICIGKRVKVSSTDGADVTVIDPDPHEPPPGTSRPPELVVTVLVTTAGAQLGGYGHGFTIYGHSSFSIRVGTGTDTQAPTTQIIGNTALKGGILLQQSGPLLVAQNTVRNAADIVGGTGLQATSDAPITLIRNVAEGNPGAGFFVGGLGKHIVRGNTAINNNYGFAIDGPGSYTLAENVAVSNDFGFTVEKHAHVLRRNTAVGNNVGFSFANDTQSFIDNSFHTNNMIGNQICGVINQRGNRIDATNNYWGSPTGPGAKPADAICNASGTVVAVPFSTKEFRTE